MFLVNLSFYSFIIICKKSKADFHNQYDMIIIWRLSMCIFHAQQPANDVGLLLSQTNSKYD